MFKVEFVDYKGRDRTEFIFAKNEKEAEEAAMVMQGVFKIKKVVRM